MTTIAPHPLPPPPHLTLDSNVNMKKFITFFEVTID